MRDLEKDKEICDRATPGPWYQEANYWDEKNTVLGRGVYQYDSYAKLLADMIDKEEDAEFIADAREGWPHAIERAIKAEAEVKRLRKELDKYKRAYAEICHQFNFGDEGDYRAMYDCWLDWADKEGER